MFKQIFIETSRLILRQWSPADFSPFIAMNQDANVMEFFPGLSTRDESIALIDRQTKLIEQKGYGLFEVERKDNQHFIGFAGLSNPGSKASLPHVLKLAGG